MKAMKTELVDSHIERATRKQPNDFMMVVNAITNNVIGKLINISETGIQLLMQDEIELNQVVNLALVIKDKQNNQQRIIMDAQLVWVKQVKSSDSNVLGGFSVISKNFKSKFRLNQLLKSLS